MMRHTRETTLGARSSVPRRTQCSFCERMPMMFGWLMMVLAAGAGAASCDEPDQKVDFNFQVLPILSDKCFNCHGPDPRSARPGCGLTPRRGPSERPSRVIMPSCPGNLDDSELVGRITAEDETERMPPKSLGRSLSRKEIDLLKRWIEQGAEWKAHWAFLPPSRRRLPTSRTPAGPEMRSTALSWPAWTPSG